MNKKWCHGLLYCSSDLSSDTDIRRTVRIQWPFSVGNVDRIFRFLDV